VALRELGLQGVSARPLAILPILPGSIATGSRSDTLPRQALAGILIAPVSRRARAATSNLLTNAKHLGYRHSLPTAIGCLYPASTRAIHASSRPGPLSHRAPSGNARLDHSPIAVLGTAPRVRPRTAHSRDVAWSPASRRGIALPSAAPARATEIRDGDVGDIRATPARSCLSPHAHRTDSARRTSVAMAAVL